MSDRDLLLRVYPTGAIHPVGMSASQQLKTRVGEWQLVPSPSDLIVARLTGSSAVLKLAGEIKTPGALCDIVALIAQSQWRGELVVLCEAGTRWFYFDAGSLVGAHTDVKDELLGEVLWRFGVVTREQLETIVNVSEEKGKRVGEVAVELDLVAPEKLFQMMATQVEETFYGAVQVSEGAFFFFDRYDERKVLRRHNMNAGGLLMEAARRMDEMRFFREKIPSDQYIPMPVNGKKVPDDCVEVFAMCDGQKSIADIGRAIGQLEFEVTRAVFQLLSSGCVTVISERPRGPEAIVRDLFNPALAAIHERCDGVGKGAELREALARFATGGGVYDPLFMGAGPQADGTLKPARLAGNLATLAGEDPDEWLAGLMNDYVGFGLFQAESLLPRETQSRLVAEVMETLKPIAPLVDSASQKRAEANHSTGKLSIFDVEGPEPGFGGKGRKSSAAPAADEMSSMLLSDDDF